MSMSKKPGKPGFFCYKIPVGVNFKPLSFFFLTLVESPLRENGNFLKITNLSMAIVTRKIFC